MYGKSDLKKVKGIGGHLIDIKDIATLPIKIGKHLFYQKFYIFYEILHSLLLEIDFLKVSNGAKIRNRYNQVPHLTQDTNGKVTNSQKTPQTRAKRSALSQQVTTKHI